MIIKIYFAGLIVLVGAIAVNALAKLLKLPSWYDFLSNPKVSAVSLLWLFIIYPLLLGLIALVIKRIL